jgi:hypothetical protein
MLFYKLIIVRCFGETLHSGLTHIYSGKWSVCRHCTVMCGFFVHSAEHHQDQKTRVLV